jgi:hypothetical protein
MADRLGQAGNMRPDAQLFSGHMIADYIFVENEDVSDSSGDILVPITRVQVFWRCQCIPNYKKK